ncbi:tripartite tricarboxylate transporter substrate binding protein [Orrella sp. JC864]|uniref:Bug family tripartite tricarboxylate transporter substrate binding protein n=1 Tax=Orrella sp. JC864 TaxID=3120298 RepID=UPI00300A88AD
MKQSLALASALLACSLSAATAAELGKTPITLVSPFPPGGGTDTLTRMLGAAISSETGWNIVVENKPGAGGNLALDSVARAQPNGHTLVMAQTDNVVLNPWLYKKLSYDTFKDFKPVALVASSPSIYVVMPQSPYRGIEDVNRAAKEKPGVITVGVPGVGSSGDLLGHLWRKAADVDFTLVPYRGWAQAYPDLASGRIDIYNGSVATLLSQIQAGAVRPLAVVGSQRSPALPEVPTFVEKGYKEINQSIWWGLMAPGRTPDGIIEQLNAAVNKAIAKPEFVAQLRASGYEVLGGTPAEFAQRYKQDYDAFGAVIKEAGIEPQ